MKKKGILAPTVSIKWNPNMNCEILPVDILGKPEYLTVFLIFQVKPPTYQIYNVDDANMVFDQLNECRITGRAVLQVCNTEGDDDLA